jgi:hypothetical protein
MKPHNLANIGSLQGIKKPANWASVYNADDTVAKSSSMHLLPSGTY